MHKIGILGGSFDPIHCGHIAIATSALEECGLEKVLLMPTKNQPFKVGKHVADEMDRLNMVKKAAEENDGLLGSSCEIDYGGISYTYNTLKELEKTYKDGKFYFILGTDAFISLETWYMGKELLSSTPFILAVRPGYKESERKVAVKKYRQKYNADITVLNNPILYISSTEIRERVEKGESISELVPKGVEEYIVEHGLYRKEN